MNSQRPQWWKWAVCALLLLATMLNYMDRQTLSLTIKRIQTEANLTNEQYGNMEVGFGIAFALGGLLAGFMVDRISARWLYPLVLIGWSLAGIATARIPFAVGQHVLASAEWLVGVVHAVLPAMVHQWIQELVFGQILQRAASQTDADYTMYAGLFTCRTLLGFFEAGHWPCALVVTQRILAQHERSFGNSLLQSGAAIGAILTPFIVKGTVTAGPGGWQPPFVIIGLAGMSWIVPWLLLVRGRDLAFGGTVAVPGQALEQPKDDLPERRGSEFWRRFAALMVVVVMINMTWQFFRAWLPKFLIDAHQFSENSVAFAAAISAYYICADIGCIAAGYATRQLAKAGWSVHQARMTVFTICVLVTMLSLTVPMISSTPLLLVVLMLIGAGALGLFPNYYSFSQELSARNQGKVTGILGALTWVITSIMQKYIGKSIDREKSYAFGLQLAGFVPALAVLALLVLWPRKTPSQQASTPKDSTHG